MLRSNREPSPVLMAVPEKTLRNTLFALLVGATCTSLAYAQAMPAEPGGINGGAMNTTGGASGSDLPDIGSPASATITKSDEYRLGAQIVRSIRDQKGILEDPEVSEYLQSLGQRLAAQAPDNNTKFTFFPVREGTINAFALPGGFIGVNYGTVLASRNESELAGVVGHEIAHVTQRHMARTYHAQGTQSIASNRSHPRSRAHRRDDWRRRRHAGRDCHCAGRGGSAAGELHALQ